MLKYRFFIAFCSTALFYLCLIFLFFTLQHLYIGTEQKPKEERVTLSLATFEPIQEVIEEPVIEPIIEPIEEKVEPPKEEPVVEEVPELVVEKIVEKITPVVKKKKKVKKKIKKKRKKKKVRQKRTKTRKVSSKKTPKRTRHASPAKKNKFLSILRAKIDKNKTYPRIAKRRRMQGVVSVKFTILANGHVTNIRIKGPKVFHSSARNAVKKSFPIPMASAPISPPTTVNFKLRYQIR